MFGFGFLILIVVSAYVANLAAFLTMSVPNYIGTMEEVVAAGLTVCANPVIKEELEHLWPKAKFFFEENGLGKPACITRRRIECQIVYGTHNKLLHMLFQNKTLNRISWTHGRLRCWKVRCDWNFSSRFSIES